MQIQQVPKATLKERAKMRKKLNKSSSSDLTAKIKQIRGNLEGLSGDAKKQANIRLKMAVNARARNTFEKEYGKDWRNKAFGGAKQSKGYMGAYSNARKSGATDSDYRKINRGNTSYNASLLRLINKRRKAAGKSRVTSLAGTRVRKTNYGMPEDSTE